MGIDDRDSLQENLEAIATEDDLVDEGGVTVADGGLDDVSGGSGYVFTSKCIQCGEPLPGRARRCPKCGYRLPPSA